MTVKHLILSYDEINDYIESVRNKLISDEEIVEVVNDIEIIKKVLRKLEELARGVYLITEEEGEEEKPLLQKSKEEYITSSDLKKAVEEIKRYIDRKINELKE